MGERDTLLDELYGTWYSAVAATGGESPFARYMHRAMERAHSPSASYGRILELGANRGEHIPYVRHSFDEYVATDLRAPEIDSALTDRRISTAACDAENIPFPEASFDRVIATCLLHHLGDPLRALGEMRRVTRTDGNITLLVPTDPCLAYRVGQALTSGRKARQKRLGSRWALMHAVDHRNHFRSLQVQIRHTYRNDLVRTMWLPWRVPIAEANVLTVWQISIRR